MFLYPIPIQAKVAEQVLNIVHTKASLSLDDESWGLSSVSKMKQATPTGDSPFLYGANTDEPFNHGSVGVSV